MLVHRYVVHRPIIPAAHILRLPSHLRHFQDFTDDGSRMRTARDSIYWIGRDFHYGLLLDAIAFSSLTKFVQKQPLEKTTLPVIGGVHLRKKRMSRAVL